MSFTETIAVGRTPSRTRRTADRSRTGNSIATGPATWSARCSARCPPAAALRRPRSCATLGGRTPEGVARHRRRRAALRMLFLAPLLGLLPHATLAAVVIVYSIVLIQPAEFFAIRKVRTMEFRWAVAAALGVLIFGTLNGIVVAIILSLIGLASQAACPRLSIIGRKRGADVLRPPRPNTPTTRPSTAADPAAGRPPVLRQRAICRRADQGAGRRAQATRRGAGHEPRVSISSTRPCRC